MHTFSCAAQSVTVDGVELRFDADPGNYSECRLYVGDHVAVFNRNGLLDSVRLSDPPIDDVPADVPASEVQDDERDGA